MSAVPPVISGQSEEFVEEVGAVLNGSVSLQCEATGTPPPSMSWLRDGEPVEEGLRFRLLEAGRVLEVSQSTSNTQVRSKDPMRG